MLGRVLTAGWDAGEVLTQAGMLGRVLTVGCGNLEEGSLRQGGSGSGYRGTWGAGGQARPWS